MKLTAGKLRYLMTVDGLQDSLPKVRCIDIAVQLGISRASVCKMPPHSAVKVCWSSCRTNPCISLPWDAS